MSDATIVDRIILIPRLIRLRDAPGYLGMDKNRFNREVRPYLPVIPIGVQGIAFDRMDLDAWVDNYKSLAAHPAAQPTKTESIKPTPRTFISKTAHQMPTKHSEELEFAKALEQALGSSRTRAARQKKS